MKTVGDKLAPFAITGVKPGRKHIQIYKRSHITSLLTPLVTSPVKSVVA
jgi:hypothetical protein